jgi:HK97 family phage prohead protease
VINLGGLLMPADEPIVRFTIPASSLELRSAGADEPGKGRTVIGVAVPWGETAEIMPGVKERIERGAFDGSEHVLLRTEHGTTIGSVQFRETDTGVEIEAPISRTASGDEAVTLIEDKVWDKLSVGFQALEGGTRVEEDGTYVRTKARLLEVSLTGIPSYLKTTASLREAGHEEPVEKGDNMPDTDVVQLRAEVTELRQANEDFVRRLEALPTNQTPATIPGAQFRSAGEWLKALVDPASREEAMKVVTETRAFLGTALATDTDVKGPTWLADAIRIVNDLSVAIGCFRNAPLPGTGMSMEYLKFGESSLQVQVQSEEGQTLSFGKLSLDTDSASIATYGGYSSLSFQAIRRAPIDVLNTTYELLARQAAIRSNRVFVSLLSGAVTGSYQAVTRHGSATPSIDQWVDSYIDSQIALTDTGLGLPAEGILVSTDVYRTMLRVRDGDYRLVSLPGMTGSGSTSLGTVNLSGGGVGGTVLGFTVRVEPGLPAGTNLMYNRAAATVWGDRTPTRLGPDEDITNLTSEVSVYFLQSQAVQFPTGIVSIKAGV